jgi:hypothetical protein
MDRTAVDLGDESSRPRPAGAPPRGQAPDADAAAWRQFAKAATPDAYYRSWLALQCRLVPGVASGVLVLGNSEAGPFAPAAFWPPGGAVARPLAEVAERALAQRRGLVTPFEAPVDSGSPARQRYAVERLLSPGEFAKQTPILKLAQIDPLRVEVIAPVALLKKIAVGMRAQIMLEAPVNGAYEARVTVVDRVVDAASGTFGVRLELPNPGYKLPAGLKCKARFPTR